MLSDGDRRVLAETACALAEDDPQLNDRLTHHRLRGASARDHLVLTASVTLAVGITIGLLLLGLIGNAALFVITVAALIVAHRWRDST